VFFFSSRRRHTRSDRDWSSDVCSSDLGYHVALVDKKCCGRPLISKGMLAEARAHAAWNVARLAPYARRSIPIVGLEPSCLLTLRDESVDLLRTDDARTVARHAFLLDEFLQRERTRGLELRFAGDEIGRAHV